VNGIAGLAPLVLIAVVFWFLLIRPQRRRQLDLQAVQRGIDIGDEVMLGAGILGRVAEADDEFLRLEVDPGVHLKVARQAVVRVIDPDADRATDPDTGSTAVTDTAGDDPGPPTDPTRDH
jgi:preprotein translocase subunit YajC